MNCDASFREMVQYANEFGGILLTRDRMDDVAENLRGLSSMYGRAES